MHIERNVTVVWNMLSGNAFFLLKEVLNYVILETFSFPRGFKLADWLVQL